MNHVFPSNTSRMWPRLSASKSKKTVAFRDSLLHERVMLPPSVGALLHDHLELELIKAVVLQLELLQLGEYLLLYVISY